MYVNVARTCTGKHLFFQKNAMTNLAVIVRITQFFFTLSEHFKGKNELFLAVNVVSIWVKIFGHGFIETLTAGTWNTPSLSYFLWFLCSFMTLKIFNLIISSVNQSISKRTIFGNSKTLAGIKSPLIDVTFKIWRPLVSKECSFFQRSYHF